MLLFVTFINLIIKERNIAQIQISKQIENRSIKAFKFKKINS
jgi:hypothetical protein